VAQIQNNKNGLIIYILQVNQKEINCINTRRYSTYSKEGEIRERVRKKDNKVKLRKSRYKKNYSKQEPEAKLAVHD
jgi:hypothetical protein